MENEPSCESLEGRIETIRRFNRLYTGKIGLLQKTHLGSPFSLTEARILFELGQHSAMTASDLCAVLALDQGYVSRIVASFQKKGLIARQVSEDDGRVQHIALTKLGQRTHSALDGKAREAIAALLKDKSEDGQRELVVAAKTIENILEPVAQGHGAFVIRAPRSGDLGWVVHRHGVLYAEEYGWDVTFEAVVAEIVANFAKGHDPARERCWIAERRGAIVGAVFLVRDDSDTARLRLLYVEPAARGLGLGRQLVEECTAFARAAGYRKIVLWTHDDLVAARKIYEAAGFRRTDSQARRAFGTDVVSENWERSLT